MADNNILKNTFSKIVNDYEYARPTYPAELYQKICEFSKIEAGNSILEVGAGTGQATKLFANQGYDLDLLEVSDEQVEFLKKKYADNQSIKVNKAYFEDFMSDKKYDLIYSATAFHWIKSEVGYPKAWEMLKDGGTLAVFWQMSSVTYYSGGIFDGLNAIKQKYMPDESLGFDEEGIEKAKEKRIMQVQSGGYFKAPEVYEYRWTDIYDADRYVTLLNTYSSTQVLEKEVREKYLEKVKSYIVANGGKVEMPQLVCLYLVKKEQ